MRVAVPDQCLPVQQNTRLIQSIPPLLIDWLDRTVGDPSGHCIYLELQRI